MALLSPKPATRLPQWTKSNSCSAFVIKAWEPFCQSLLCSWLVLGVEKSSLRVAFSALPTRLILIASSMIGDRLIAPNGCCLGLGCRRVFFCVKWSSVLAKPFVDRSTTLSAFSIAFLSRLVGLSLMSSAVAWWAVGCLLTAPLVVSTLVLRTGFALVC